MKDYSKKYNDLVSRMERLGARIPATMNGFAELHKAGVAEGVLSTKTKELIAVAIAITVRSDNCIAYHVHDALQAGASSEEILETIGVAIFMGGGPSVAYGSEALAALEQFVVLEEH